MSTPLDELRERNLAHLTKEAKRNDAEGALARLLLKVGSETIPDWLEAEGNRAGSRVGLGEHLIPAIGAYIAAVVVNSAMAFEDPISAINGMFSTATQAVFGALTGERRGTGVEIGPDGTQREITLTGVIKERLAEAKGGRR